MSIDFNVGHIRRNSGVIGPSGRILDDKINCRLRRMERNLIRRTSKRGHGVYGNGFPSATFSSRHFLAGTPSLADTNLP